LLSILAALIAAGVWGWLTKAVWVVVATLALGVVHALAPPTREGPFWKSLGRMMLTGALMAAIYHYIGKH